MTVKDGTILTGTALAALLAFGAFGAAKIETWRAHELVLTASQDYAAGGGDAVKLDVTFSHPKSGEMVVRAGFWDGGKTFRVRFAPPKAGGWTWKSACDDDAALNGRRGGFLVEASTGTQDLFVHGFPQAGGMDGYLVHADGTPLLHLAGGAAEPAKSAFNVKDGRVDAADLAGLKAADKFFQARADAGQLCPYPGFLPADELPDPTDDASEKIARYLDARFGAYPAVPKDADVPWTAAWSRPLRKLFASVSWWELRPEADLFRAAPGVTALCAARGDSLFLVSLSGKGRVSGGFKKFDRAHAYEATWVNPRTGEVRGRVALPGVADGDDLALPPRPDTREWVVKVEKLAASAPHVSSLAARGPRDLDAGTLDWNRAQSIQKGVKLLTLDEKVSTPLDPADQKANEAKYKISLAGKRTIHAYLVRIDLRTPGFKFTGTPRAEGWGRAMPGGDPDDGPFVCTVRQTPLEFMQNLAPDVAKARQEWSRDRRRRNQRVTSEDLPGRHPVVGFSTAPWLPGPEAKHNFAEPLGVNVSDGVKINLGGRASPAFVVWKDGKLDIVDEISSALQEDVWIAHAGVGRLLADGEDVAIPAGSANAKLGAALALGLSRDRTFLYLLAVDGGKPELGPGAVGADVVRLLRSAGAWDALSFDGTSGSLAYWDRATDAPARINKGENRKTGLNIVIYRQDAENRNAKEKKK